MSDILDRLRAGSGGGSHWQALHTEAADVIERLEKELIAARAELMREQKRLDWALAHEAGFHESALSWSDSTGAIVMRIVPSGLLRETIDVLMGSGSEPEDTPTPVESGLLEDGYGIISGSPAQGEGK